MRKENIVICKQCGKSFNNYYAPKTKHREFACSRECGTKLRKKFIIANNKRIRHQLRKEHKCIICKVKIKPTIIYHQFCPKHKQSSHKSANTKQDKEVEE